MGSWWLSERAGRESEFTSAYREFLAMHEHRLEDNPRLKLPLAQIRRRRNP